MKRGCPSFVLAALWGGSLFAAAIEVKAVDDAISALGNFSTFAGNRAASQFVLVNETGGAYMLDGSPPNDKYRDNEARTMPIITLSAAVAVIPEPHP